MKNIFNRYCRRYDAWYEKNKFAYLSELEAIKKILPNKSKGLEIGVGTGRFAAPLGIKYGIDPSKRMLEIAKKRGVKVHLGSGEKLHFKNSSFNYVAIIITLCFVKDPIKVLAEARRVLKKNGKVIVGIIDKDSFLGKFYQRKKSLFYKEANFYSVKDAEDILELNGFKSFSYYQTVFSPPNKMRSLQKSQIGFGKGGFVVISAYKSDINKSKIYRKFTQHERIRFLFKKYGYDMVQARQKVFERAGRIKEPLLDAGTGPGRMAYTLARHNFSLTSIDISKEAQGVARVYARRYNVLKKIKFIIMDAERIKFKDKSFFTTVSANLLHDVKDPKKVVQEMIRVTKNGGKIIISDLNKKGKALVNKVCRIDKDVHRGKPVNLEKTIGEIFKRMNIKFKKYDDGYITTYIGEKYEDIY